jgi:hypothetical protein
VNYDNSPSGVLLGSHKGQQARQLGRLDPDARRAPIGTIHWVGAGIAEVWSGYMDGAVHSGETAAEVLAAL